MTDKQLVDLINFITDRFYGARLEHKQVLNAVNDWKRENVKA